MHRAGRRHTGRARSALAITTGVVLIITAPAARALDPGRALVDYGRAAWTTDDGLPQSSVQAVLQTRDGFLWVGTAEGLARFDGIRFTVFDSSNTPELGGADVSGLLETRDGSLWIAAYGRGPVRYRNGSFRAFEPGDGLASVTSLAEDGAGGVFVGTDAGVYRQDGDRFLPLSGTATAGAVKSLLADGDGGVWIGASQGLGHFTKGGVRWFGGRGGVSDQILALARDVEGRVWVGTVGGLFRLDAERLVAVPTRVDAAPPEAVRALLADREGSLWFGSDLGVARLRDGQASAPLGRGGLTDTRVLSLAQDREGSLWIGTYAGGLNQLKDVALLTYTSAHGLAADEIGTVALARAGGVFVGLDAGEIYRLTQGRLHSLAAAGAVRSAAIGALHEDPRGRLWVGSEGGLLRYEAGRWKRFTASDGVPEVSVRAVFQDSGGRTWIGTEGAGVVRLSPSDVPTRISKRDGLPSEQVRAFLEDRDGTLWIATYGGLVAVRGEQMDVYTTKDGLPSEFVRALYEDAAGTLWIGTYGGGLARRTGERFTAYRARDGLFSDVIYAIVPGGEDRLWMSCNRGIFSVGKANLEAFAAGRVSRIVSTAYGRADGMLSVECTGGGPGGVRADDGRLYFATVRGLVVADLARLGRGPRPPAPVFTMAQLDGSRFDRPTALEVPAGSRRLEFEYASLSFVVPERLRFQSRLEGFDPDWSAPTRRRLVEYTNVPPGEYSFAVRVVDESGQIGGGVALPVRVRAHWHQTRAFLFAGVGAAVMLAWSAYRLRLRVIEARARALQQHIEDAVAKVRVLKGLLPICSSCKKIRNDAGYWNQIEQYIREHSEAEFTHGLCPDCAGRLFPAIRPRDGG